MKKYIAKFYLFLLFPLFLTAQERKLNEYGLFVIDSMNTYNEFVVADSSNELIDLEKLVPGITLDIQYATENNFTKEKVYTIPKAFLRKPAALAIKKIQEELAPLGLGLKIYDAYRPYAATKKFFEIVQNPDFAASPTTGSRHNRGCAVDVTLINLKTGEELTMPTPYDDFTENAHAFFEDLTDEVKSNRKILQDVMTNNGFNILNSEWWHFDYKDYNKFELMDISFEELLAD